MDSHYITSDFYTAAVLVSQGFNVSEVSTASVGSKVKKFHFANSPELKDIQMKYLNGSLEGNIRSFKNAIETIKDIIHSD